MSTDTIYTTFIDILDEFGRADKIHTGYCGVIGQSSDRTVKFHLKGNTHYQYTATITDAALQISQISPRRELVLVIDTQDDILATVKALCKFLAKLVESPDYICDNMHKH